jgi:hypothetical protein
MINNILWYEIFGLLNAILSEINSNYFLKMESEKAGGYMINFLNDILL